MGKAKQPYGSWASPITTELITAGVVGLAEVAVDGEDVYWIELRPTEKGRSVVVRRTPDGMQEDVIPAPFDARTRVHEYGGGTYLVHGGEVVFSNFSDQRLYRVRPGSTPEAITPEASLRFADGVVDERREHYVYVREDHRGEGKEPENAIVALPFGGGEGRVLASGHDFFASPRLSPDGAQLAWISWDHPNMPWDDTELWLADLGPGGGLEGARRVAGGPGVSVVEPRWAPDGSLFFVSDANGWWNLHRAVDGGVECVAAREAEFSSPAWSFGLASYAFVSPGRVVCVVGEANAYHLEELDVATGAASRVELPYPDVTSVHVGEGWAALQVAAPDRMMAIARLDLEDHAFEVLALSSDLELDPAYISMPRPIRYASAGGRLSHAFYYPPTNARFEGPDGEQPPLLVLSHGGPTGAVRGTLRLGTQYWTSRGFGVIDVNYGGSTGYGRAYRESLKGTWGIVDVEDCIHGARHLVAEGEVDGARLAIRGGSAGGYTTLAALAFHDVFAAGASHFGVSDLEALARDTHKFESRYLDGLIGPYPEAKATYVARSPIHHVEGLSCPVILLQGLEDPVVPPSQAERMLEALDQKGIAVAYVPFEGEQHGFRQAKNIRRALEAELYFYGKVFGFEPADEIAPVDIRNL